MILECRVPKPFICMLRGVNVGGNQMIRMDTLRAICHSLGYANAQTLLQSGNVVFHAERAEAAEIEAAIRRQASIDVKVFLRTPAGLRKVIAANPFPDAAKNEPSHLIVMFFDRKIPPAAEKALREAYAGPEPMQAVGRELYIYYGEEMGRSKLNSSLIEKKMGMQGTARNWNTVQKLLAAAV